MTTADILARADLATVIAAITSKDPNLIHMSNGDPATPGEQAAVMSSTKADWEAATRIIDERIALHRRREDGATRAADVLQRYARRDGEPSGDIVPRMTPADRAAYFAAVKDAFAPEFDDREDDIKDAFDG